MSKRPKILNELLRDPARAYSWGQRSIAAIGDRVIFALTNFIFHILLARWLSASDYGAFAVAYSILVLMMAFHNGLIVEPMLVFGSGKYADRKDQYLSLVFRFHWVASIAQSIMLGLGALVCLFFLEQALVVTLVVLAVTSPLFLFQLVTRIATYVPFKPRLAVVAGIMYGLLAVPLILLFHQNQWLSPNTALGLLSLCSVIAGIWIQKRLKLSAPGNRHDPFVLEAFHDHLNYGRWAVGTGILGWIPGEIYFLLLPVLAGGLEAAGIFRALRNVVMPPMLLFTAVGVVLTTFLVQIRDRPIFDQAIGVIAIGLSGLATIYWVGLGLFGENILSLLYGQQYVDQAWLLWIMGLAPIIGAVDWVLSPALRALERPDNIFWAKLISSMVTLTVGIGLMILFELAGAAWGIIVARVASVVLMAWILVRLRNEWQLRTHNGND